MKKCITLTTTLAISAQDAQCEGQGRDKSQGGTSKVPALSPVHSIKSFHGG